MFLSNFNNTEVMKGSYILLMQLDSDLEINIGRIGTISFKKGYYAYVGSGLNSLDSRIKRHLKSEKKIHWHIDYFLLDAKISDVYYKEGNKREECDLATYLSSNFSSIPDFGCSDCKCSSHLFYGTYDDFLACMDDIKLTRFIK